MSAIAALALCGPVLIAAGGGVALAPGRLRAGLALQAAGLLVAGVAGAAVFAGAGSVGAGFRSGISPAFGVDPLSGFFLVVLAVAAVPALVVARDALPGSRHARGVAAATATFLLALAGVITARDVTMFLACWELMTLAPAAGMLMARGDEEVRQGTFTYVAITHIGGAGVWLALLLLAAHGALGGEPLAGGPVALVIVAALIGFSTKAGLVPLHTWLPRAHPLAPSHLSAVMSGVMIKVALYGLIRVLFEWVAPPPLGVGLALLAIGTLSALIGILYALLQHELKRLLAFSSIENAGIVAACLGASLALARIGQPTWAPSRSAPRCSTR